MAPTFPFFRTVASPNSLYLVKISDDFVKQPQALQSFLVDVRLGVELFKVWDGGEHDTNQVVGLVVEILQHTTVGDDGHVEYSEMLSGKMLILYVACF